MINRAPCARVLAVFLSAPAIAQISRPVSDEVFYHFMPIAWRDSNNDTYRYGDFNGMTASLDYLQNLGVTAVWMNPIYPSPAYHGYHHFAPSTVNSWFGTETEFFNFVAAAHARGIKVFVDLVAYGVNRDDIYYASAYNHPTSIYDTWLAFTNSGNTQYSGSTYTTWNGATVRFIDWDMRDAANAGAMRNQEIAWCRHWLDPNNDGNPSDGIDGFRADHVLVTNDHGPDGWGYNLGEFWTPWHNAMRATNPAFFSFAEQADWGSYGAEFLSAFNGALAKPMLFAIRDAVNSESAAGVSSAILSTLAVLPADAQSTNRTFMAELGDHDVDRFMSVTGNNWGRARAAAAILMTQPFTPMMYYGDEIGMRGTQGNWGTDANDIPRREPFKWNAVAGPPMSNYFAQNSSAYNARLSQNNDGRSVQEQQSVPGSLLETYRSLIGVRKNSIALKTGTYTAFAAGNAGLYACLRHADSAHGGPQGVLVLINMSGASVTTTINLSGVGVGNGSTTPVSLLGPVLPTITNANKGAYPVTLPAYTSAIATVDLTPPPEPVAPADIDGRSISSDAGPSGAVGTSHALQTCATGFGDNLNELDGLYLKAPRAVASGALRVGITGNLEGNANAIVLLIDAAPGGQNVLATSAIASPPAGIAELSGTRLDAGFSPDTMFFLNASGGSVLYVDQVSLPASPGVASKAYRGSVGRGTGRGVLNGGTNPNDLFVAFDNANTSGVTGSGVSGASAATTGLEMLIPYADLFGAAGPTCGSISVGAFITSSSGSSANQFLPGLPLGTSNPGTAPNLTTYAGNQFLSVLIPAAADLDDGSDAGVPDGGVDINDLLFFLGRYEAGALGADLDDGSGTGASDGGVDINDLLFFLTHYEGGC